MKNNRIHIVFAFLSIVTYVSLMIIVNKTSYGGLEGVYKYVIGVGIGAVFFQVIFSFMLAIIDRKNIRLLSLIGIYVTLILIIISILIFTFGAFAPAQ